MNVEWIKCKEDQWCGLDTVNLQDSHFDGLEGVYIIWHGGSKPATVRVGQGVLRDMLAAHRNDDDIQAHAHMELFTTWASVNAQYRDGVEAYIAVILNKLPNRESTVNRNGLPGYIRRFR